MFLLIQQYSPALRGTIRRTNSASLVGNATLARVVFGALRLPPDSRSASSGVKSERLIQPETGQRRSVLFCHPKRTNVPPIEPSLPSKHRARYGSSSVFLWRPSFAAHPSTCRYFSLPRLDKAAQLARNPHASLRGLKSTGTEGKTLAERGGFEPPVEV